MRLGRIIAASALAAGAYRAYRNHQGKSSPLGAGDSRRSSFSDVIKRRSA